MSQQFGGSQQLMHQVFTSMKTQFAQISLARLSQILPDAKPHLLAQELETVIQACFDNDIPDEKVKASLLRLECECLEKREFFELMNKPLLRLLKRQQKKIQQLVQFHTRPSEQQELNRIKLDKILRECFMKIQHSTRQLYNFIDDMERNSEWECSCKRQACRERQSFEQFCIDMFAFFYRSSKIINQEIMLAQERFVELHPLLSYFSSPRLEYSLGHKAGQLLFQLEKSCELSKSKKKKRNKKNKERQAVEEQRSQPFDEDQLALNSLIESVDWVKQQKEPCVVSEEWLLRISKRKDALKK